MQELGGSLARQIAKLANAIFPYHRCYAEFMNGGWPGDRKLFALLFSMSLDPLLSRSLNFFKNLMISDFCDPFSGIGCE